MILTCDPIDKNGFERRVDWWKHQANWSTVFTNDSGMKWGFFSTTFGNSQRKTFVKMFDLWLPRCGWKWQFLCDNCCIMCLISAKKVRPLQFDKAIYLSIYLSHKTFVTHLHIRLWRCLDHVKMWISIVLCFFFLWVSISTALVWRCFNLAWFKVTRLKVAGLFFPASFFREPGHRYRPFVPWCTINDCSSSSVDMLRVFFNSRKCKNNVI